ncbi:MAG: ferrochelatase [Desulfobacteraceae bacterium 4572_35.1]|nr:MAG: ferrochelatase [Desulfobacteraceae bacterium 4572_35.1]
MAQTKKALILLNMGGPDSLEAVEPFLYNLFSDRDLIQLPLGVLLQKPFARLISYFRAKTVRENYRRIGGRSPQLDWSRLQAEKIAAQLGEQWRGYVVMRYWAPRADEVVEQLRADGITQAVVVSLYPHYTAATTGSSIKDFKNSLYRLYPDMACKFVEEWHDWSPYLDALAECITDAMGQMPTREHERLTILFSAHALPQKFIDRGDPYQQHIDETIAGVMARVGDYSYQVGYQSRSGPVKWMGPDTRDVIAAVGKEQRSLLVVPVSFVSDHIETLEEVDVEFCELALQCGVPWFGRVPALNDRGLFINALKELVLRYT